MDSLRYNLEQVDNIEQADNWRKQKKKEGIEVMGEMMNISKNYMKKAMQEHKENKLKEFEKANKFKGGIMKKIIKQVDKEKKEKAEYLKNRYECLNIELVCPICHCISNLNRINRHMTGLNCKTLSFLLPKDKLLNIKHKIKRLKDVATDGEIVSEKAREEQLNKIMNERSDRNEKNADENKYKDEDEDEE